MGALMNLELFCMSKRQKLQMRWQTKLLLAVLFSQMAANLFVPVLAENIQPPPKTAAAASNQIDLDMIERLLHGSGVKGEIHTADLSNRQLVFTYRDPENFFKNEQFVMASGDPAVQEIFSKIHRYDQVLLKGEFFHQDDPSEASPQMHIRESTGSRVSR
jgi:hypothetical protein